MKNWKCNHCKGSFWNISLERLFEHLTCLSILCTSGILPCDIQLVPEQTRTHARSFLALQREKKQSGEKREAQSNDVEEADDRDRTEKVQSKLREKTVEACEVDNALSDWFDGLGVAHAKVSLTLPQPPSLPDTLHSSPDYAHR